MSRALTKCRAASAASAVLATRSASGTRFFRLICDRTRCSPAQRRHMLQILPALLRAAFVAGLVLGGDQRVGAAAPFGGQVKVTCRTPNTLLDMGPPILDRLQVQLPLIRRNQERAQSTAVATCAFEWVGPGPIPRRLQRQGDALAQVVESRLSEPFHRRPSLVLHK